MENGNISNKLFTATLLLFKSSLPFFLNTPVEVSYNSPFCPQCPYIHFGSGMPPFLHQNSHRVVDRLAVAFTFTNALRSQQVGSISGQTCISHPSPRAVYARCLAGTDVTFLTREYLGIRCWKLLHQKIFFPEIVESLLQFQVLLTRCFLRKTDQHEHKNEEDYLERR